MKKIMLLSALLVTLPAVNAAEQFTLSSADIKPSSTLGEQHVLNGFGCTGNNQSPQISWENAPKGTKSFALTAYDPDAPTGSGWWHWVVYDINKELKSIPRGVGSQEQSENFKFGRNDFGQYTYGGACPPEGQEHRYQFTVYALDIETLPIDKNVTAAMIGFFIKSHTLAEAKIEVMYKR
jgi:Raf kinase inhibitor-like YbhB/YbcL family protein